ncbi:MAG: DNA mismatch repair endonuclease MutL [Acidobacteria bacterium]|nr:DNA mismatch repair endonuclease MutL [Acidobacteriota bacterium]
MGRIRILSDEVANKIAAGEVVERPASVVKELLENALDAGATEIRIEAESGGRRLIRVADNGSGMLRDDALLAFERHATSKLSEVKDLLAIATLGFRGEALPSIASVSRLLLETRSREETTGAAIEIAGGKLLRCDEAALAPGTAVTVRDLFYNVPARKKFLRSEQTEMAHIASLATHYSLAHPDKRFDLRHGAAELLSVTPVETLRERVYQVFGDQMLEDLIDIGVRERELPIPQPPAALPGEAPGAPPPGPEGAPASEETRVFCLRGFVSRPQVQKLNRNSIFLFVNGRLIRDRLLLHGISAAYYNLIPAGSFPFALLFLDCDAEEVDVNVHPSKTEVRFRHGSVVHDFARDSIREALVESRPVSTFPMPATAPPQTAARLPYSEFSQAIENQPLFQVPSEFPPAPAGPGQLPEVTLRMPQGPPRRFEFAGPPLAVDPSRAPEPAPVLRLPVPDTHGGVPGGAPDEPQAGQDPLADLRPLGQIHESVIVAAGRDGLWIIDQHVAHERVLFEKILRNQAAGRAERQQLLMPLVIQLTAAQQVEYARIAGDLHATGFETELFGTRTIAVQATPAGLNAADVEKVVFEILEIAEKELRRVSAGDLRRAVAATIACRAAIKVNTRLDAGKMEWLLRELAATECPMSCPHGRPVALRYSTRDILRGFHRI